MAGISYNPQDYHPSDGMVTEALNEMQRLSIEIIKLKEDIRHRDAIIKELREKQKQKFP